MQFFTVFAEFFLIGLVCWGMLLPAMLFDRISIEYFISDVSKIYLVGLTYVLGLCFHWLSRLAFAGLEVKTMKNCLEEYSEYNRAHFCTSTQINLDKMPNGNEIRKLFRTLRHVVGYHSATQLALIQEQDQLLRVTRGMILPCALTMVVLFTTAFLPPTSMRSHYFVLALAFAFLIISVMVWGAFGKRTEDYHRNTLAAYIGCTTGTISMGAISSSENKLRSAPYTAIVFDLDGTLVNSLPAQESAWRSAIKNNCVDAATAEIIMRNFFDGYSGEQMFLGAQLDKQQRINLRRDKDACYHPRLATVKIFPHMESVLSELSDSHKLAVATTSSQNVTERLLNSNNISSYFSILKTADDVERRKPDPEGIFKIAMEFDTDSRSILLIGDSLNDWLMARNANCDFLLVRFEGRDTPPWAGEVPIASTPLEILKILQNVSSRANLTLNV